MRIYATFYNFSVLMQQEASNPNDNNVIEGIRAGDFKILSQFYADHFRAVEKLILVNHGNSLDAEDIYQEAVTVLYENLQDPGFRLSCRPGTYLYSVARNLWRKRVERDKDRSFQELPEREYISVADSWDIALETEFSEKDHLTRQALFEMGDPCKAVLEAYYFFKKSMEAIATEFNYKDAGSAKNQKYKCLKRLQEIVLKRWYNRSDR